MSGTEEARWDRFLMQKKLMRWCCGKRSRRGWGGSVGAECNTQDANCLRPLTFAETAEAKTRSNRCFTRPRLC